MDKFAHLVGVPFAPGARGPHAYDCYGLVMACWRLAHNAELPDFLSPEGQGRQAATGLLQLAQHWQEVPRQPGVMAAIRIGRLVSHCGFMLDDDAMIHAWKNSGGVSVVRLDGMKLQPAGFYRHVA